MLPIPVSAAPRADPKLAKTIAVAGIVADPDDFVNFWKGLADHGSERFTLVWETKELIALKNSMVNMIKDQVRKILLLQYMMPHAFNPLLTPTSRYQPVLGSYCFYAQI